jgi:predicted dithiol-disulfide oxidoreductase (DUF899 family)
MGIPFFQPAQRAKEHTMTTLTTQAGKADHPVVSDELWLGARRQLLAREKELTHLRDQVARERRELPWRRITSNYVFDTPAGKRTLAELFAGRR